MTSNLTVQPGDIVINKLTITPLITGQALNIINQVITINIFENIFSPTLYAEFTIYDPIDMINTLPVRGEETINVSFNVPGREFDSKYEFAVVQVSQVYTGNHDKDRRYILRCVTIDHLNNAKQKITQRFKDYSNNIVQSILTNYIDTSKKIDCEITKGTLDIIIAKQYPFQAIDYVRRKSISKNYLSSSFVFFENQQGYHLRTIEGMMDLNKQFIGDKVFFYDTAVLHNLKNITYRNILAQRHLNHGETLAAINQNSSTRTFDFFTKNYKNEDYQGTEGFDWADQKSYPWHSSSFMGQYDEISDYFLVPKDSSKPEDYFSDGIGPQRGFAQQLAQNISNIYIWGDNSILAGDVITATIPTATGFTTPPEEVKLVTNNFLVSKVRHMITLSQNRIYNMSLELLKGRIMESI